MSVNSTLRGDVSEPVSAAPALVDDHIYLWDAIAAVLRGWRLIVLCAIGMFILAGLFTIFSHAMYRARVVVADAGNVPEGAPTTSQLREITSLLSNSPTGGTAPSMFDTFMFLITSQTLAARIQDKHDILPELYAGEWNAAEKKWEQKNLGVVASLRVDLQELFGFDGWSPPSAADLSEFLKAKLVVTHLNSGINELSLVMPQRALALKLLTYVVNDTESLLRETSIAETGRQIDYLESQLKEVSVQEHRVVLTNLLLSQEQKMMMMRSGAPVAVRILDGPSASDLPVSPNVFLNLMIGLLGGTVLGVILIFLINAWKYRRASHG